MSDLNSEDFEVTTVHQVSFHDHIPYEKIEIFLQGMGMVMNMDDHGAFQQVTIDFNDAQFKKFCDFVGSLD